MNARPPLSDDDDLLAAEYVIGLQDHATRAAAARRVVHDRDFAARVTAWEEYLENLNEDYGSAVPPDRVKKRIDAVLFDAPKRRWIRWLTPALALAGVLAAALLYPQLVTFDPELRARLESDASPYVFSAAIDTDRSQIEMALLAGEAPTNQTFELWFIPDGGAPRSLGIFEPGDRLPVRADVALGASALLAVSLEPAGGSPTGAPTGPVLALGVLSDV